MTDDQIATCPVVPDDVPEHTPASIDLTSPARFLNRELSWLDFNQRVIEEAENTDNPLLERLRFLSIAGNNLDEFIMVRLAGLKAQERQKSLHITPEGLSASQQITAVNARIARIKVRLEDCWRDLRQRLEAEDIVLVDRTGLTKNEQKWLQTYFDEEIFPVLTPISVDPPNAFPFLPNLGFSIIATFRHKDDTEVSRGLLLIPAILPRFVRLPGEKMRFVAMEQIISDHLSRIFGCAEIVEQSTFRVIRDSELALEEDAEDLVILLETALKRRRRGKVIHLATCAGMPGKLLSFLCKKTRIAKDEALCIDGPLDFASLGQLIVDERHDLMFTPYKPRFPQRIQDFGGDCFAAIRTKDILVHHPYESFDVVVQFLQQAAQDPQVLVIKQTLYRTSNNSPIVAALIKAAENGKSVTAMIELKARFDEEANLRWARDLERSGVQVIYGFVQLKTHAKISLVIRREDEGLHSYVHYGTGNYHPITAQIYTDLSYFTCNEALCKDATLAFNYMTGHAEPVGLQKLILAPFDLRKKTMALIKAEIAHAKAGRPASIWAKMNSLVDPGIIDALYKASCAGVSIRLLIRGICCLRPGVPGLSDTIEVHSIVGRFLEHSRIMCFGNGHDMPSGQAQVFISSADWMPRNLNRRIETMVPIENETVHRQILHQIMETSLEDTSQTWSLGPDGQYRRLRVEKPEEMINAHQYFMTNPSLSGQGSAS